MRTIKNILKLQKKNKGINKTVGTISIKNETESAADLCFYGDINSDSLGEWKKYYPDNKAPSDVKEFLDQLKDTSEINIHINSGGGSVFGGIAIYNILKNHKAKKTVYVDGIAASIASVIAMAGDKIIIPANAQMMIHKPSSITWGNADDMRHEAEVLDGCQKLILSTYMQHAKDGITEEEINALIDAETWKNGKEWQDYFDIETAAPKEITACTSDYFDSYKNMPDIFPEKTVLTDTDIDHIAGALLARLKTPPPEENKENEAVKILSDLDYFV